jgi:hypothetical protein
MDIYGPELFIQDLSRAYSYRFPTLCYRCGRTFPQTLIDKIEKYVRGGYTLMEATTRIRYMYPTDSYLLPGEEGYTETLPLALTPRDLCCRISLITPFISPTGTKTAAVVEPPKNLSGPPTSEFNLFDFMNVNEAPRLEIDSEHKEIRLFIEDGIEGFEPPITWTELDDLLS